MKHSQLVSPIKIAAEFMIAIVQLIFVLDIKMYSVYAIRIQEKDIPQHLVFIINCNVSVVNVYSGGKMYSLYLLLSKQENVCEINFVEGNKILVGRKHEPYYLHHSI